MPTSDICPICGLPKDLCVCQSIAREQQRIKVKVEKRKWGREVTIIDGIMDKDVDLYEIAAVLKSKLACGGTAKNGRIELQGNHKARVKELLVELGFPAENIDVE
ncbi:MAG: stress response translation initiation inhibitor YciH [Candidatus Methanomethylicota archaeon]|uniref:Protein translation factor SUI1 homolog n=1 Tax=Thermoproteota archaeon TaxID=2056631 RepID=A0A497EW78_9CREN|nr:MAG: stress response translation initiation inhibitor YciH [Candidatus Verstraetearchaeota archaeon]RLE54570.1 MAG: stress response translation initiation inhibitor YciH [Candidatus Verstraetearchaeota archaeon]RLI19060.1 MAG: stress response translation initiation inhibitor YciH [Candidatus Bathyarchaeota archaeon]